MSRLSRITATNAGQSLSVYAVDGVTASATSRTLSGVVVRYGVPGHTSRGKLKVAPGALQWPEDLGRVKLTREHDRDQSRGHLVTLDQQADHIRASLRVSDGPEGDAAIREAQDRTRDGLSFDIVDATIEGDTITSGRVVAIGQVGIPAYDDGRIDTIAASHNPGEPMTEQERARLAELAAMNNRTTEQEQEFQTLQAAAVAQVTAPAPAPEATPAPAAPAAATTTAVAASMPAVPSGVPAPSGIQVQQRPGQALATFYETITAALQPGGTNSVATITAALQDITHSAQSPNIEQPAWSGELWSGLLYEPQWTDLFNTGSLTSFSGLGWRFTSKLAIQDYAGDKAAIPSDNVTTEQSTYEAARMAVGVDIDRKFFDFPNEGFIASLFEQVRESWAIQLDAKVRAYTLANAVMAQTDESLPADPGVTDLAAQPTLLKAAAAAVRSLKRRRVGKASWVYVNDDDLFTLLDVAEKDVSAFLELFGIDPKNFRSSSDVPEGTVLAGVKPAATVRTLPGSPIRVDAQNLANGGVDEAFFGYWAVEEHHKTGISKVTFTPA